MSRTSATEYLKKNRSGRRIKCCSVHGIGRGCKIICDIQIEGDVGTTLSRLSRCAGILKRVQVCFKHRVLEIRHRGGIRNSGTGIAQNGQVEPTVDLGIRLCANPVIIYHLVCIEDDRVTLTCKDLNRINHQQFTIYPIDFDNCLHRRNDESTEAIRGIGVYQCMSVDRDSEILITRNGNQPETISFALNDINNSQGGGWTIEIPAQTIDKRGVGCWCDSWWH